jgi:hypothetical protein
MPQKDPKEMAYDPAQLTPVTIPASEFELAAVFCGWGAVTIRLMLKPPLPAKRFKMAGMLVNLTEG